MSKTNNCDLFTSRLVSKDGLSEEFPGGYLRSSLVAHWVKDLALSPLRLGSLPWHGFDPWPVNFCVPWVHLPQKMMM